MEDSTAAQVAVLRPPSCTDVDQELSLKLTWVQVDAGWLRTYFHDESVVKLIGDCDTTRGHGVMSTLCTVGLVPKTVVDRMIWTSMMLPCMLPEPDWGHCDPLV